MINSNRKQEKSQFTSFLRALNSSTVFQNSGPCSANRFSSLPLNRSYSLISGSSALVSRSLVASDMTLDLRKDTVKYTVGL